MTLTPKQFLALNKKSWREIHWTSPKFKDALPDGINSFYVGYEKKGVIVPFGIWIVA